MVHHLFLPGGFPYFSPSFWRSYLKPVIKALLWWIQSILEREPVFSYTMLGDPTFPPEFAAVLRRAEFPVVEICWVFCSFSILLEMVFVVCGLGCSNLIMINWTRLLLIWAITIWDKILTTKSIRSEWPTENVKSFGQIIDAAYLMTSDESDHDDQLMEV